MVPVAVFLTQGAGSINGPKAFHLIGPGALQIVPNAMKSIR